MDRRSFVRGSSAFLAYGLSGAPETVLAQSAPPETGAGALPEAGAAAPPFTPDLVLREAEQLAQKPYQDRSGEIPDDLRSLSYDQYRRIRYRDDARIWADAGLPFTLDFFHPGFMYVQPVRIFLVDNGVAMPVRFSSDLFEYGENVEPPKETDVGFSGFRARTTINTPDYWDEFLVFQGASYFRAIGRNQRYGLSARGLAINTAEPEGEEFPSFVDFWIERPKPRAATLIVHALLDSASASGAYTFRITPGAETVIEVEAAIFPREEIKKVGVAPLTSMFLFDATNRDRFDDFRSAVHDSNGLQMLTGAGEWIWRPLANPTELQISAFSDRSPRGFGLMQRARRFEDYQDFEAKYERRPSLWIEPLGDWGTGAVELVEIPTAEEINDNIVAYWRPNGAVPAGGPWHFSYRMRWTDAVRPEDRLLVAVATRMGLSFDRERELVVVDFQGGETQDPKTFTIEVSSSAGSVTNPVMHGTLPNGAVRVSFELDPEGNQLCELRLRLMREGRPASETWLYRWTAS